MSLLNNKDAVNSAFTRTVAAGCKRVSIKGIRETPGKPTDDGSPIRDTLFLDLQLEEDAKTDDGADMKAGAVISIGLNSCDAPGDDEKLLRMNEISARTYRQLIIAAMRLPKGCKDAASQLEQSGGPTQLVGRVVVAEFKPSKTGINNVNKFSALPENA